MVLLTAAIVVSLKVIGALLVEAMVVVPAAAARNLARGARSYLLLSVLQSLIPVILRMGVDTNAYGWFYFFSQPLVWGFGFLIVLELFDLVLTRESCLPGQPEFPCTRCADRARVPKGKIQHALPDSQLCPPLLPQEAP